jgi:hypothetical protein
LEGVMDLMMLGLVVALVGGTLGLIALCAKL